MKFIINKIRNFSLKKRFINYYCSGWSGRRQWNLFREVFSRKRRFKFLAILGVYRGRDLAYMCEALKYNKNYNFKIYALDLFEQELPFIIRNGEKIWQQDHSLELPSLINSKKIIKYLGFSKNVEFIKGDFSLIRKINDKLDFSYVDIAHDYQSTKEAIDASVKVGSSDMLILGDDYGDGYTVETEWGVKKAVQDSFNEFKVHYNWIWESEKKFYKSL
jgi:hypothetical protein